ncbi:MAG: cytochrome c biogenesis protein CcsA, partial [Deltaproteobacteria bacterium]|nr:cytochrome c biogenesis protein CcsA [Deltaproteobacteria bacterium]
MSLIDLELISFKIALILCAVSTVGYLFSLLIKKVKLAKISTWILAVAFGFLTVNLLLAVINSEVLINPGSRDFLSLCAWSVSAVYLALQFKTKTRILGSFISPFILLFMIAAAGEASGKSLLPQNLQSWLTAVHLFCVIMGEALFIIASCAGLMFLIQNRMLKHQKLSKMSRLLPSLNDLDRINHICLLWGFPVLSMGIIAGAVFAELSWQSGWMTDPKIIWTFAGWIIYGFLLHQRLAISWKGYRMAVFSGAAFILLLLS